MVCIWKRNSHEYSSIWNILNKRNLFLPCIIPTGGPGGIIDGGRIVGGGRGAIAATKTYFIRVHVWVCDNNASDKW